MSFLSVRHDTVYRYSAPVRPGAHRMMFRPRESHDLRLIRTSLTISPTPTFLRWFHDPFDNSVAIARFEGTTRELRFESTAAIELLESAPLEYAPEDDARMYPFRYADEEFASLTPGLVHHDPSDESGAWARQFLAPAATTGTLAILRSMAATIRERFTYVRRLEQGVQTSAETLRRGQGSCRDFAVLMMEAGRSLGIATRFVSGYVFVPGQGEGNGQGATHAWMQAYLPDRGWIDFDPTNGSVGNRNLIRVGVAWTPEQVAPLRGSYEGAAGVFETMEVTVAVSEGAR